MFCLEGLSERLNEDPHKVEGKWFIIPVLVCRDGTCIDLVIGPTSPSSSSSILFITVRTALSFSLLDFLALIFAVTNCVVASDKAVSPEVQRSGVIKDGTGK